jgi:DNA polymerase (family X)
MQYSIAHAYALKLKQSLIFSTRCTIIIVGSLRRKVQTVSDIDLLVISRNPDNILNDVQLRSSVMRITSVISSGTKRKSIMVTHKNGQTFQVDLFVATPAEKAFALFHHTGSTQYNIRVRAHANQQGWRLNQYGLFYTSNGRHVPGSMDIKTEKELARFLGITYRTPSARTT